jgi:hypothetical protein
MKKLLLLLCLIGISLSGFSQSITGFYTFFKPKLGHNTPFRAALEKHVTKYRKIGSNYEVGVYYIEGGKHQGEYMYNTRAGLSWTEKDSAPAITLEMWNDFALNVSQHLEAVTGAGINTYAANMSNAPAKSNDNNPKRMGRVILHTLKFSPPQEFWDVIKKHAKYWDKKGYAIAVYYSATGSPTLIFNRRLPNGFKDLEGPNTNREIWEELYGKDSYDKDMAIMRNYIVETDMFFAYRQPRLSSK